MRKWKRKRRILGGLLLSYRLLMVSGAPGKHDSSDPEHHPLELTHRSSASQHYPPSSPPSTSLVKSSRRDATVIVAPDGTIYFVEVSSGRVLWSFSSGSPIHSSYHSHPDRGGESERSTDSSYIDIGEDWQLYIHGKDLPKVKLPVSVEEFLKKTPLVSGGGIIFGTKKSTVFVIDVESGRVFQTFISHDSAAHKDSSLVSLNLDTISEPLYVTRKDYSIEFRSAKTNKIVWHLTFVDIEASFQCKGMEQILGQFLKAEKHIDNRLMSQCSAPPMVYRIWDRNSLDWLFRQSSPQTLDFLHEDGLLPLPPSSNSFATSLSHAAAIGAGFLIVVVLIIGFFRLLFSKKPHELNEKVRKKRRLKVKENTPHPEVRNDDETASVPLHDIPNRPEVRGENEIAPDSLHDIPNDPTALASQQDRHEDETASDPQHDNPSRPEEMGEHETASASQNDDPTQGRIDNNKEDINELLRCTRDDIMDQNIGQVYFSTEKVIGRGSEGTMVFEGTFQGYRVAVKRILKSHVDLAREEHNILKETKVHTNIVRFHVTEMDEHFYYIVMERSTCNLNDLVLSYSSAQNHRDVASYTRVNLQHTNFQILKSNDSPSCHMLKLMRDVVCGLSHLHSLRIIHRDLKPQNVLINDEVVLCAKISDMGISRILPDHMLSLRTTSGGLHPFGEHEYLRDELIRKYARKKSARNSKYPALHRIKNHEAHHLISSLLEVDPKLRPEAAKVRCHPLFWDIRKRLDFLGHASDWLEGYGPEPHILVELENAKVKVMGMDDWDKLLDSAFSFFLKQEKKKKMNNYNFGKVISLVRMVRNKYHHFYEFDAKMKRTVGQDVEEFMNYISKKFPELLIEVYKVMYSYYAEEEFFDRYFKKSYVKHIEFTNEPRIVNMMLTLNQFSF